MSSPESKGHATAEGKYVLEARLKNRGADFEPRFLVEESAKVCEELSEDLGDVLPIAGAVGFNDALSEREAQYSARSLRSDGFIRRGHCAGELAS